jgi:alpha-tubulin suppressor-like RCC1 family protein
MMKNKLRLLIVALLAIALILLIVWPRASSAGRLRLPSGPVTPVISLGDSYGLVVAADGTLWSWGHEDRGFPVLGQDNSRYSASLVQIDPGTNWLDASAGDAHALALKGDGSVWSWGGNFRQQLGNGSGTRSVKRPRVSLASNDCIQVSAGFATSFVLKKDGTLWGWGLNNFGQLGTGLSADSPAPTQIGSATNWVKVRSGGVSSAGIQSNGTLWIWGGSPKMGNSKRPDPAYLTPSRINEETNWSDVTVAFNLWVAVKSDGTLWVWGRNAPKLASPGAALDRPTRIGTESDWDACVTSSGGLMQLLKKRDGSFWVLDARSTGPVLIKRIELPADVVAFGAGGGAFAVVTKSGEVWTWGMVLGQPTVKNRVQQFLAPWCWKIGWKVSWGVRPEPSFREQPWQLQNLGRD